MSDLDEQQLAVLIEDHLDAYGVAADGRSLLGATEAIAAVVGAIERTWDLVIPARLLEQVRDRTELVTACVARIRRHVRLRARRTALPAPASLQVRVEPPAGCGAGGFTRSGTMTAYDAEELVAGALRWGPGTRLVVVVRDGRAGEMVEALVDRTLALGDGAVRVEIRRSGSR